ncbi:MAG: hypothetical protein ACE5HS_06665 [bacterium]
MSIDNNKSKNKLIIRDLREGYQPTKGKLDASNPPKGGSGVPSKNDDRSNEESKKE